MATRRTFALVLCALALAAHGAQAAGDAATAPPPCPLDGPIFEFVKLQLTPGTVKIVREFIGVGVLGLTVVGNATNGGTLHISRVAFDDSPETGADGDAVVLPAPSTRGVDLVQPHGVDGCLAVPVSFALTDLTEFTKGAPVEPPNAICDDAVGLFASCPPTSAKGCAFVVDVRATTECGSSAAPPPTAEAACPLEGGPVTHAVDVPEGGVMYPVVAKLSAEAGQVSALDLWFNSTSPGTLYLRRLGGAGASSLDGMSSVALPSGDLPPFTCYSSPAGGDAVPAVPCDGASVYGIFVMCDEPCKVQTSVSFLSRNDGKPACVGGGGKPAGKPTEPTAPAASKPTKPGDGAAAGGNRKTAPGGTALSPAPSTGASSGARGLAAAAVGWWWWSALAAAYLVSMA